MTDATHLNNLVARGRDRAETHMPELEAAYADLLRAGGRVAASNFEATVGTDGMVAVANPWEPPTGDLVDAASLASVAAPKVGPIHRKILAAVTPAGDLGITFDVKHPTSQALLAGIGQRLGNLGDAIRTQVNETVAQGYAEGWSVARTARAITDKVDAVTPGRAAALARTDLNGLSNGAAVVAGQIAGATTKTWKTAEDDKVRPEHADADGQTVPIDQPFTVGGEQAGYPGSPDFSDELAMNCRCVALLGGTDLEASAAPDHWTNWTITPEGGEMTDNNTFVPGRDPIFASGDPAETFRRADLYAAWTAQFGASGDTTLPLSERARAWDASEATARLKKWASNDGSGDPDTIDYGKLARGYFWRDTPGDGGPAIGDLKFPFADLVNGKLTAVWRGVTAGAARLSSAKGVDVAAIQKRMNPYYAAAAKAYDDKTITPPWADGSHSAETLSALRELVPALAEIPDDQVLAFHALAFAAKGKHRYAGSGGKCAICGEGATNKDTHFQALTAGIAEFTLIAAAGPGEPTRWVAPAICVENQPTEDGRILMSGSTSWRDGVLPLGVMTGTPHGDLSEAPLAGGIDTFERIGPVIAAGGYFNDNLDPILAPELVAAANQAIEGIKSGTLTGISVDLMVMDGGIIAESDLNTDGEDELPPEVGEDLSLDPYPDAAPVKAEDVAPVGRLLSAVYEGVIGGACIVPVPAIGNASISVVAAGSFERYVITSPLFPDCACGDTMIAAALPGAEFPVAPPLVPPAEWFEDPKLDKPTPLTITDDGRVFGHVAPEGVCHEGYRSRCVLAPRSRMGYRKFMNGEIPVAGGERINVGKITLKAGHAGVRGVSEAQARAHYDNTATIAAFVRAGDDRHGIWVAGALQSELPPKLIRDLMASPLSGDWRDGEMVAAHAVIDPGFPVLRASGLGDLLDDEPEEAPSALSYLRPGRKAVA